MAYVAVSGTIVIVSLVVRKNDRVRVRIGNLTMTNHPIHLHGHNFSVALTDGGWVAKAARWPEVSTDVAVGQMRAIEFLADNPGDWAFHCHMLYHMHAGMFRVVSVRPLPASAT